MRSRTFSERPPATALVEEEAEESDLLDALAAAEETKTCSKAPTPAVKPEGPEEGSQSQLQVQAVAEKPKTRKLKGMPVSVSAAELLNSLSAG